MTIISSEARSRMRASGRPAALLRAAGGPRGPRALRAPRGLRAAWARPVALACALGLFCLQAPGALGQMAGPVAEAEAVSASATLGQCVTSALQSERSATFSGEMTAISGSARMSMRIDVQVRLPGETRFHIVSAPGLGVWRGSDSGVRTYRYVKQVTNLSAPAFYRASVGFRWMTAKGRLIRHVERRTAACGQPAAPPVAGPAGIPSATPSGAGA